MEQTKLDANANKVKGPVALSDLGIPDQDGYDLIREVWRRGHYAANLPCGSVDRIRP
jgi:hypothetical protein